MYYVSSNSKDCWGITDTEDGVEEFYDSLGILKLVTPKERGGCGLKIGGVTLIEKHDKYGRFWFTTHIALYETERSAVKLRLSGCDVGTYIDKIVLNRGANLIDKDGVAHIPDKVDIIEYRAFEGCTSLRSITIPAGIREIKYKTFAGCTSLRSITIPASVREIENEAFRDCISLRSITIPASVREIGNEAFNGCTSLCRVDFPGGVNESEVRDFNNYALLGRFSGSVKFPSGTGTRDITSISRQR